MQMITHSPRAKRPFIVTMLYNVKVLGSEVPFSCTCYNGEHIESRPLRTIS